MGSFSLGSFSSEKPKAKIQLSEPRSGQFQTSSPTESSERNDRVQFTSEVEGETETGISSLLAGMTEGFAASDKTSDGTSIFSSGSGEANLPEGQAVELASSDSTRTLREKADREAKSRLSRFDTSGDLESNAPAVSEDGSARVKTMHMASGSSSGIQNRIIEEMARIGEREGFEVATQFSDDPWMEDYGEFHEDGTASFVPRMGIAPRERNKALKNLRDARLCGEEAESCKLSDFTGQGGVDDRDGGHQIARRAAAGDLELDAQSSYTEGGNVLAGAGPNGEKVALVGKDSLGMTQLRLEKELGRPVSAEEAQQVTAADLGRDVVPIEQPGDFHLDMSMTMLGDGRVVLNDAMESYGMAAEWSEKELERSRPTLPENPTQEDRQQYQERLEDFSKKEKELKASLAHVREEALRKAEGERRALEDLEAAGFDVKRMAGSIPGIMATDGQYFSPPMNFLNAEQGTGEDGKRYYIALGGTAEGEAYASEKLSEFSNGDIDRMYFLNPEFTSNLLKRHGGINCLVKSEVGPS